MKKLIILLLVVLIFSFYSCSSIITEKNRNDTGCLNTFDYSIVKYRAIYVIHGDGSYLYYDSTGHEINADKKALQMAQTAAEIQPNSEVFIFYLKPKKHFLYFFPKDDREFFHYVSGTLVEHESYKTQADLTSLEAEAKYFNHTPVNPASDSVKNFFLYYGHQIPEVGGTGYNASYPEMQFNIGNLAKGLAAFSGKTAKFFDLIVLSTCNNGTPGVISAIAPFTKYIIASPEDLHLSYMSNNAFSFLGKTSENYNPYDFARRFAETAFKNLQASTRTVITVSLYDVEKVTPFLNKISSKYERFISAYEKSNKPASACEDCKNHKIFNLPDSGNGVEVFYRPPQFGRLKSSETHSGWGCLKTNSL